MLPASFRTTSACRNGATRVGTLLGSQPMRQKHSLPDLPYDYNALEPVISAQIMKLHHDKHHNTYVTALNTAEEQFAEAQARGDVEKQVSLHPLLRFNGGGHVNHSIFWTNLGPKKDFVEPSGNLRAAIDRDLGGLKTMTDAFNKQTAAVQGSGWGWLGYSTAEKRLKILTTPNQDMVAATYPGVVPLLGVDVWEHAYYLDYKNVRPDYLKAIWEVVNWKNVSERFDKAQAATRSSAK